MSTNKTALIDLDGTLADYDSAMNEKLAELSSPGEEVFDLSGQDSFQHIKNRIHLIQQQNGFWLNLPKIEVGFEVLDILEKLGYKPHILTKGPYKAPNAWTEKYQWCKKHIPNAPVTITEDKSLVYGKILFDDWPPYIEKWLVWRPRGLVLMLDHPYNQYYNNSQVIRIYRNKSNLDLVGNKLKEFKESNENNLS